MIGTASAQTPAAAIADKPEAEAATASAPSTNGTVQEVIVISRPGSDRPNPRNTHDRSTQLPARIAGPAW
jgi:hypothetical protein